MKHFVTMLNKSQIKLLLLHLTVFNKIISVYKIYIFGQGNIIPTIGNTFDALFNILFLFYPLFVVCK